MSKIDRAVDRAVDRVSAFIQTLIPANTSGHNQVVCIQCHRPVPSGYLTTNSMGFKLNFCSNNCAHTYWYECGQHGKRPPPAAVLQRQFGGKGSSMTTGPRTCQLPGCNKPCFVEGTKVHDYCGRSHAQQAKSAKGGSVGAAGGSRRSTQAQGFGNQIGPIYFYNRGAPYYEFTNFYEAMVRIDGQDWLTTEHYFQAQKFVGTPLVRTIRLIERPREAFDKSRDPRYSHWRRSDWEEVKEDIMFKALQAKFTQYQHLKKMLVGTKDRQLVERSPYDSYWGDGGDGSGKNRLGVLLMRLRKDLTSVPTPSL